MIEREDDLVVSVEPRNDGGATLSGRAGGLRPEPVPVSAVPALIPSAEERVLVRITHGSHLYGTSTAESDVDLKSVHVPSGREILLQRADRVIDRRIKVSGGVKNTAEDVDDQSYSVKKFLEMLVAGDTNAAEILFAPPSAIAYASHDWPRLQAEAQKLINRQCRGFVGYCRRQAAKYGIKGSRMSAVKRLVDLIEPAFHLSAAGAKLETLADDLEKFAASEEHADWVNMPHPSGAACWHIECCDRKMPMTVTIKEALAVYQKVWENYGERARAAMTNEGIDWKAVSHAVRVARQAIELLDTGRITFPRPDAAELLEIKQGKRPYSEVSPLLEKLVEEVEARALVSHLPEKTDIAAMESLVLQFYSAAAQETPTRQRQDRDGLGPKDGGSVAESDAPDTDRNPHQEDTTHDTD